MSVYTKSVDRHSPNPNPYPDPDPNPNPTLAPNPNLKGGQAQP